MPIMFGTAASRSGEAFAGGAAGGEKTAAVFFRGVCGAGGATGALAAVVVAFAGGASEYGPSVETNAA